MSPSRPVVQAPVPGRSRHSHMQNKRFELLEKLGSGACGTVWRAWDECLQCEIALKMFTPEFAHRHWSKIAREVRLTRSLAHPNIVRVYELHPDLPALSMELVVGRSLDEVLRDPKHLDADFVRRALQELCNGVEHAHGTSQLVHRDIKPSNILVSIDGTIKIVDFGISAIAGLSTETVLDGSGTPAYMSPEQARGDLPSYSDDIFAIGITAYYLIVRELPRRSRSPEDGFALASSQEEALGRALVRLGLPLKWGVVIRQCFDPDPGRRPRSAADLSDLLFGEETAIVVESEQETQAEAPTPTEAPTPADAPTHAEVPTPVLGSSQRRQWSYAGLFAMSLGAVLFAEDISPTPPVPFPPILVPSEYVEYLVMPVQVLPELPVPSTNPPPVQETARPPLLDGYEIEVGGYDTVAAATFALEQFVVLGLTFRRASDEEKEVPVLRMGRCLSRAKAEEMAERLLASRSIPYRIVAVACVDPKKTDLSASG